MANSDDAGRSQAPPSPDEGPPGSLLPHPYQTLDPDGHILAVNEAWLEVLGYDRSEIEGRHFSSLLAETSREQYEKQFDAYLDEGTITDLECRLRRADGKPIDVSFDGQIEYDDTGSPVRTHCQFTDITERRAHEAELESEKAFVESSLDALSDVFYVYDERGTLVEYNDRFPAVTGYDPDEVESLGPTAFFPPERRQAIFDRYERIVEDGEQIRFEEPLLTKSGETIPFEFTASPYRDASGTVAGFVGTGRDISDQREQQRQLTAYEQAVEGSTDLLSAADTDHQFLFANRAYREYHGIVEEDIHEKSLETVLGPERFATIEPHLDRALAGETVEYEMERPGPDGSLRALDIRYYPLRDEAEDIRGVAAAMRDVTDQKEMAAELEERNRQLSVMDRVLRHNLHNEMNVIQGYADLVRDRGEGDIAEYANTIDDTADRLLRIADKQREITKLLAAQPETEELDLAKVVRRTVDAFQDRHPSADVTRSIPESLSAIATPNVETAIEELLGNAAVYSDRSEPTVAVRVRSTDDHAVVRVADRGPGIPEMERKVLTGEEAIAPLYHGSGLGLWLVKVVVKQSNGTLDFEENDPRGSVVTIRLLRG